MTWRRRRSGIVPVDRLQELQQLPPPRSARAVCEGCGHEAMWHFQRFGQCYFREDKCWWFRWTPQAAVEV